MPVDEKDPSFISTSISSIYTSESESLSAEFLPLELPIKQKRFAQSREILKPNVPKMGISIFVEERQCSTPSPETIGFLSQILPKMEGLFNLGIPKDILQFAGLALEMAKKFEPHREFWNIEETALYIIANSLSKYDKVKSIYVQRYRSELQVFVLLSIAEYDGELMDILLDAEYDIRKKFSELTFSFFYPPAGIVEREDFVHPNARCIYSQ